MPHHATDVWIWLALLAAGCSAVRPPGSSCRPDRPARVRTVRAGGEYLLVQSGDRPAADRVLARRTLMAGESLGFVRDDTGLAAVAGGDRIRLAECRYSWKAISPTGEGWAGRLTAVGQRRDEPLTTTAGRACMRALEPVGKVAAVVGLVAVLGVGIYALCNHNAVGVNLGH